jgi:hypothetical protein
MELSKSNLSGDQVPTVQICAPGNVRGCRLSPLVASLTWDEPYATCDLCPNALGYEVSGEGIATVNILRPPHELRDLNPYNNYRIAIRAKASGTNISTPSFFELSRSPNAPRDLQANDLTENGVTLTWSPPSGGTPELDYIVSHGGVFVASVRDLSFQLAFSTQVTAFDIEVRARSVHGNFSDPAQLDISPPEKPKGLVAIDLSSRATALIWETPKDNVRVTHNVIVRDGKDIATIERPVQSGVMGYRAEGLTPGTTYVFSVAALDEGGNRSPTSDGVNVQTPALDPPVNIQVLNNTRHGFELKWSRPPGAVGLISYAVEIDNHAGSTRKTQSALTSTVFFGLTASSTYTTNIFSIDASERSSLPVTLEVSTLN